MLATERQEGIRQENNFQDSLSHTVKAIVQLFCRVVFVQIPAAVRCIKNFMVKLFTRAERAPEKVTICYRPYLHESPEVLKVRDLLQSLLAPSVKIEYAQVNENDSETQKIAGPRILVFSIKDIGRLDDIDNMKTLFDKARPGPAGVVLVRTLPGLSTQCTTTWFKERNAQFIFELENESQARAELQSHFI